LAAPNRRAAAAELSATTAVVMPRAIPAMAKKTFKEEKTQSRTLLVLVLDSPGDFEPRALGERNLEVR
jgi:hypothetical protein